MAKHNFSIPSSVPQQNIPTPLTSVELMEDFSGGQFYILETDLPAPVEYLQRLLIAAKDAFENHQGELSEHGLYVATRLCQALPDVIAMQEADRAKCNKPAETRRFNNPKSGWVYVIKSPTGAYKIGKSSNPNNRIKTFEVKLPFEVEFICLIPAADMNRLEKHLHGHFTEKHINGEWFALTPEDVEYIKGLAT